MHAAKLEDAIQRGLGMAARHTGGEYRLFRPTRPHHALSPANQRLALRVTFSPLTGGFRMPVGFGHPGWSGLLDTAYTRPGDYLVAAETPVGVQPAIWFIAAQQPLLPAFCLRVTREISITRPDGAQSIGISSYGGAARLQLLNVVTRWPASVLLSEGRGSTPAAIPGDITPGSWSVLFPTVGDVQIKINDRITDDLGRAAIVAAAELTDLGWRLTAREVNV